MEENKFATRYNDLIVWQKSMDLVVKVYKMMSTLPKEEKYGLCDQMRRSAVSIPSNIAEGYERGSAKENMHFLSIANGSRTELMTQIEICERLGYIDDVSELLGLCTEIGKMLNTMIKNIKARA